LSAPRLVRKRRATLASVAELSAAIDAWARARRVPEHARRALLLVHDELASNVARHAGARAMSISCRLDARRGRLHYRLEDDGAPFDSGALGAVDTDAPLARRTAGGLGIHLVRTLARSFRWRRIEERNRIEVELALEE
jgi:anti-sigma regulatory factor (Ser/Thr protein kinase)